MLLRTAQGDSYGAGFEYGSDQHVLAHNTLKGFVKNERHNLLAGRYTDDTQMAIAIVELILDGGPFTQEALADAFVRCFKRDQREGYARGFYAFLCEIKDGAEFLAKMKPFSDKSGGAMRAVPLGIYPDIITVKQFSALQAALTHNTADGINAAVAASLMGHYFLYNLGKKADLGAFLAKHVGGENFDWSTPWTGKVGEKGWMSVRAAATAVMQHDSLSDILRACVAFTGDVDTVAAVALGAAAASPEVKDDLPAALYDGLEDGAYGRTYIEELDERLERCRLRLCS